MSTRRSRSPERARRFARQQIAPGVERVPGDYKPDWADGYRHPAISDQMRRNIERWAEQREWLGPPNFPEGIDYPRWTEIVRPSSRDAFADPLDLAAKLRSIFGAGT